MDICFTPAGMAVIGTVTAALVGALKFIFNLLMKSKDQSYDSMKMERDGYSKLATQSVTALEFKLNEMRRMSGLPPIDVVPPVLPDHNSPITIAQQEDADYNTLKARYALIARILQLPPELTDL